MTRPSFNTAGNENSPAFTNTHPFSVSHKPKSSLTEQNQSLPPSLFPDKIQEPSSSSLTVSQEDLKSSLLNKLDCEEIKKAFHDFIFKRNKTPINQDMLEFELLCVAANFLGGGLLTGGNQSLSLDGLPPGINFQIWDFVLNQLDEAVIARTNHEKESFRQIKSSIKELLEKEKAFESVAKLCPENNCVQYFNKASNYVDKILALKTNESFLFYTGWSPKGGDSGHAMIIEFKKIEDGLFDVLVYNSTGFSLSDSYKGVNKTLRPPYVKYSQVPKATLFVIEQHKNHSLCIQALLELQSVHPNVAHKLHSDEDVAEILEFLEPYRTEVPKDEIGASTGQRGGTCVPSVTKELIMKKANSSQFYKRVMHHFKLKLAASLFISLEETLQKNTQNGMLARRTLSEIALKLGRRPGKLLDGLYQIAPITADESKEARATSFDIVTKIKGYIETIETVKAQETVSLNLGSINADEQTAERKVARFKTATVTNMVPRLDQECIDLKIKLNFDIDKANSLTVAVNKTFQLLKRFEKSPHYKFLATTQLQHLIDELPLPKIDGSTFWDSFSLTELKKAQEHISALTIKYCSYFSQDSFTRRFATLLPLYALTHYLALKIESHCDKLNSNAQLLSYKIPFPLSALQMKGLQYFDRKEFERIKEAASYCLDFNASRTNGTLFANESNTSILKNTNSNQPENAKFWGALFKSDPDFRDQIEALSEKDYKDWTLQEIEDDLSRQEQKYNAYKRDLADYNRKMIQWNDYEDSYDIDKRRYLKPQPLTSRPIQPSEVSPPIPKVNLALDTKLNVIMETINGIEDSSQFDGSSYMYLFYLRQMAFITQICLNNNAPQLYYNKIPSYWDRTSYSIDMTLSQKAELLVNLSSDMEKNVLNQYRLATGEKEAFLNRPIAGRKAVQWNQDVAEGLSLRDFNPKESLLARLDRTLSEEKLTPLQLTFELSKELSLLSDSNLQALFFAIFFRSPILNSNNNDFGTIGAGDQILTDKALAQNVYGFINKGLLHFQNETDCLKGASFFFELAFYISKYATDAGDLELAKKFNYLIEVQEWLRMDKFKGDDDKSLLYLYNALFLSIKQDLSEDQYAELFATWTLYQISPKSSSHSKSPFIDQFLRKAMQKHTAELSNTTDPEFFNRLGQSISQKLNLDPALPLSRWSIKNNLPYLTQGQWTIDLALGLVISPQGLMQGVEKHYPWESEESFNRIFAGEKGFSYRALGDATVIFSHPEKGAFRLIKSSSYSSYNYLTKHLIQRKMPGQNGYFEYVSPGDINLQSIPSPLVNDHAFWAPLDKGIFNNGIETTIKGVITELTTLKPAYIVLNNGEIREADSETCAPKGFKINYVEALNEDEIKGLTRFDLAESILVKTEPTSTPEVIKSITFPRFQSLGFTLHLGRMVWTSNQQYELSSQSPKNLLGTISNYLYLKSIQKPNAAILLVPFQSIVVDANNIGPIASGRLAIENKHPLIQREEAKRIESNSLQVYGVYEVLDGNITPTDTDSKLFLSYIKFSQKEYREAFELMRSLKPIDRISPIGMKILDLIQELPLGEDHPNSRMVKLYALFIKFAEIKETSKEGVKTIFNVMNMPLLASALKDYLHTLTLSNNISHFCRLNHEEEVLLCKLLTSEIIHNKNALLNYDLNEVKLDNALNTLNERFVFLTEFNKAPSHTTYHPERPSFNSRGLMRNAAGVKERNYSTSQKLGTESFKDYTHGYCAPTFESYSNNLSEADKRNISKPNYESERKKYLQNIKKNLNWLHVGQSLSSLPALELPRGISLRKNGTIFKEVFECATKGTEENKAAMLYRFFLWRLKRDNEPLIDFYISLLQHPNEYLNIDSWRNPKVSIKDFWEPSANLEKIEIIDEFFYNIITTYDKLSKKFDFYSQLPKINTLKNGAEKAPSALHPIRTVAAFETNKPIKSIAPKEPMEPAVSKQNERWETLNNWKLKYFKDDVEENKKQQDLEKNTADDFEFKFDPNLLNKDEKNFAETLSIDLEKLTNEYEAGKKQNTSIALKTIKNDDCEELMSNANKSYLNLEKEKNSKEKALLAKVNAKSLNQIEREKELARIGGDVDPLLNFQDCVDSLLTCDYSSFRKKNPNLKNDDIDKIATLTLEILDIKSHQAQLKRIVTLSSQIKSSTGSNRKYYCQTLYSECKAIFKFDDFKPEEKIAMHVFSGQSGLIPYPKQIVILKTMLETSEKDPSLFKDGVIQLIMGGGKTSVIAAIALYLTARREGRAAFFTVPPSLHETVGSNLAEGMMTAFGKNLHSINLVREEFTIHKLTRLLATLNKIKHCDEAAIVSAVTLQGLELEELSLSRKIAGNIEKLDEIKRSMKSIKTNGLSREHNKALSKSLVDDETTILEHQKELIQKIGLIVEILTITTSDVEMLIDEVDIIKDCLQELNFVDGEKVHVDPTRNQLLKTIMKGMIDQTITIDTLDGSPLMRDVTKLRSNQQFLLESSTLHHHVVPRLAEYLWDHFKPINQHLGNVYRQSFIRYASGKMPVELQKFIDTNESLTKDKIDKDPSLSKHEFKTLKNDLNFLKQLNNMGANKREKEKNAAHLIAQSKLILCDLLKSVLQNIGGRNFGPSQNPKSLGKIIPYLAVNTPATTEFGYHWEAACLQYLYGLAFTPSAEEVFAIAEMSTATAKYYIQKNNEKFEDTAEYRQFNETFGVGLDKIKDPGMIELAIETVSNDEDKLLEMQYELISRHVTFAKERLSSNGYALCRSRPCRTMSGTPWNAPGYEEKLATRFNPDIGTEGRILHKLAERAKGKKIYSIDFAENSPGSKFHMKDFLEEIYSQYDKPKKIRSIIESGGLFRAFGSNAEVARSWIEFIAERQLKEESFDESKKTVDPLIDGVLFFHKEESSHQPDTLYVWKKGSTQPERIGGTTEKILHSKGMTPANYVMYFDERHTTGTDVKLPPDAISLLTFDSKVTIRTLCQSAMRPRQFLFEQDVEFVVSQATQETLVNKGQTCQDLLTNAAKAQSIKKTEAMVRHFTQQIDNIFRTASVSKVRQETANKSFDTSYAALVRQYEKFFVTYMEENPYGQYGRLDAMYPTKDMLVKLLDTKHETFKKCVTDENIRHEVQEEVKSLKNWILESNVLPTDYKDIRKEGSLNAQVMQEVQMETEVNVEVNVEQEIEFELKNYEKDLDRDIKPEALLTYDGFLKLLKSLKSDGKTEEITPLASKLQGYKYAYQTNTYDYSKIFKSKIFGTKAFFQTSTVDAGINVFHPLQTPAKQIIALLGDDKQMRWLFVSEREAASIKEHLIKFSVGTPDTTNGINPCNVWFIQPDRTLLVDETEEPYPFENPDVEIGMIEINAFCGNIDYLDAPDNQDITETWFEELADLKVRFLKLRTFRNKKQHELLKCSPTIAQAVGQKIHRILGEVQHTCKMRLEMEANKRGSFKPKNREDIKNGSLTKTQLKKLNVEFVKYLGVDPEAEDDETKAAMEQIRNALSDEVKALGSDAIENAASEKARLITDEHARSLQRFQVPFMEVEQIKWIPDALVQYLTKGEQIQALSQEQSKHLSEEQAHLIRFLNPDFYIEFDEKWQIEAVPFEHITKIDPQHAAFLSKDQIKNLSETDDNQFFEIIEANNYWDEQWEDLHGNNIFRIPSDKRELIHEDQIYEITNPNMIKNLKAYAPTGTHRSEGEFISYINPLMIEHLDDKDICYLKTKDQIASLPRSRLKSIKKEQIPLLTNDQLLDMKDCGKIDHYIQFITKSQIENFDSQELIDLLEMTQIKNSLTRSQVQYLVSDEQVQNCPDALVQYLDNDQIKQISFDQIGHLKGKDQIQQLTDSKRFSFLKPDQMSYISDDQLPLVSPEQVPGVALDKIIELSKVNKRWKVALREALSKEQIEGMETREHTLLLLPSQWIHLSKEGIETLEEDEIKELQNEPSLLNKVPFIDSKYLFVITNSQAIKKITNAQVNTFGIEGFNKLDDEHPLWTKVTEQIVNALTDSKLKNLSVEALLQLKNKRVATLSQEAVALIEKHPELSNKIPYISSKHLKSVKSPHAVSKVTDEQVHAFGSTGFNTLENGHPLWAKVTLEMINRIDSDKLINVPADVLKGLSNKRVAELDEEGVAAIQKHNDLALKVPYVNGKHIGVITNDKAIAKLTNAQIDTFGSAGFNKLSDKSPLWDRVTTKAIAGLNYNKIHKLTTKQFKHLTNLETIKQMPKRDFVYLTKEQLGARRADRKSYIFVTLTLGVVKCVLSLFASVLIPFVWIVNQKKGIKFAAVLGREIVRPFHLFWTFIPATKKVKPVKGMPKGAAKQVAA